MHNNFISMCCSFLLLLSVCPLFCTMHFVLYMVMSAPSWYVTSLWESRFNYFNLTDERGWACLHLLSYLHPWGTCWYSDYPGRWCSCWRSMPLSKVSGLSDFLHCFLCRFENLMCTFMNCRLQNVSSNSLRPTWVPYASTEVGEEVLLFSLKLMMGWCSFFGPLFLQTWLCLECCFPLQMIGPIRGLQTLISWVALLTSRLLWRCTIMCLCVCLWTAVWPLKDQMWTPFQDIPSLRIMGEVMALDAIGLFYCIYFWYN